MFAFVALDLVCQY